MASVGQVNRGNRDTVLRQTGMVGLQYLAAHKELAENEVDELNNDNYNENANEEADDVADPVEQANEQQSKPLAFSMQ